MLFYVHWNFTYSFSGKKSWYLKTDINIIALTDDVQQYGQFQYEYTTYYNYI